LRRKGFLHLTVEAVERIHERVLAAHGGSPGLRDKRLLESAVGAPQATFGGRPLFQDGVEIAAAYLFYLCSNHAFVDGNKRTALASALVFLQVNNLLEDDELPSRDVDAWEALVLDIAASKLDREQTAERLRRLLSAKQL
jgi:death-on-curing protein